MDIVIDASCILAILLGEDEASFVRQKTRGTKLFAPNCLPYEIGNSLSAAVKRRRIGAPMVREIYQEFRKLPVRLLEINIENAAQLAADENHYAYDAYYIECALEQGLPLFSLDKGLVKIAEKRGVICL